MSATGPETVSSPETIVANDGGTLAHARSAFRNRFALGVRLRELSRMFGNAVAIANNVLVLPARNSLTNGHLLVYRAGLRLMIFSRHACLPGDWSSGGMALKFSEGMYHG
jgi:hypothetical protein